MSIEVLKLNAIKRNKIGKGASRRLRANNQLPAILYGANKKALSLTINHDDMIKRCEHEEFFSQILTLMVDKNEEQVILRDLQRHPFKRQIMHADFLRVSKKSAINITVPIHFENEDIAVGVKTGGGVLSFVLTSVEITALPADIPEFISVDLLNLEVGSSISLSDIKMPKGVQITALIHDSNHDTAVVTCHLPKKHEEIEQAVEVEATKQGTEDDKKDSDSVDSTKKEDGKK
jgi:large subunit ribosomal protein L25